MHVIWAIAFGMVGVFGCGPSGDRLIPVSGKITFEGREQPEVCRLSFVPMADATGGKRPSGGIMAADGTYKPTKFRGVEGLYPGRYRVNLAYFDLKPGGNPQSDADWIEFTHEVPQPIEVLATDQRAQFDIHVPSAQSQPRK